MSSSRKIAVEFVGVFLIGVLLGGLIVWNWRDTQLSQFMTNTNDPNTLVARITQKYTDTYHLSPDEMTKIEPMIKEMAQHASQIRRQFGIDVIANLDKYHQQIAEQLTPEHRAVYEKANADRKQQISAMLLLDQSPTDQGQK